jgi:UrcA family protein
MAVLGMTAESTHLETAMNRITTIILASALAAGAQIASAADPTDAPRRQVEVHFSDLNLTSIDGATTLYHRLQSAAASVCTEGDTGDWGSVLRVQTCVSAAISAAVADINQPSLTAYYRAKHGYTSAAVRQASR